MPLFHPQIWEFLQEPDHWRDEFMQFAGLLNEREGGPMVFESTPADRPNQFSNKFFAPKQEEA